VNDITFYPAKKIAHLIKQKKISAVEVAQIHLQLIGKVNPKINAIMQVDEQRILNDAASADALLSSGKPCGPLHGVPISVKDNFLTKNIITTAGSRAYEHNLPTEDATVVKRLREAGAIILGKTNLPDFAMCWDTDSTAYGRTNNPYDLNRSAGGSSGGEAAIIASGGSALGIASDGGGSIRLPAHYCGIAGFRPSRGLIPTSGLIPPTTGNFASGIVGHLLSVGPMARFVEDLIYCLPIIAGKDGQDPNTFNTNTLNLSKNISINKLRVAFYHKNGSASPAKSIINTINNVTSTLEGAGAIINEEQPPGVTESWEIFSGLLCNDGGDGLNSFLSSLNMNHLPPPCEKALKVFSSNRYSLQEFMSLWERWDLYRSRLTNFMNNYDVIICPAASFTAIPNAQSFTDPDYFSSENYLAAYSLSGWPSVVVRAGTSEEGLPIGIQIIAQHGCDHLVLAVANYIETSIGGWKIPQKLFDSCL